MHCEYFGRCGGCCFANAQDALDKKVHSYKQLFGIDGIEVYSSPPLAFRWRCELSVFHDGEKIIFAMRNKKEKICIKNCVILTHPVQAILRVLPNLLEASRELGERLFSLELMAGDEALIVLLYHKALRDSWDIEAKALEDKLKEILGFRCYVVGRSKKIKRVPTQDFITQWLSIGQRRYAYYYQEGAFVQPNPFINQKMIEWVLNRLPRQDGDLLEMYCGCGNFTFPLSQCFDKVLATEISRASLWNATNGARKNSIDNVHFVRLSGDECIDALVLKREFKRLSEIDLASFCFSCVFVDPPRSGLGERVAHFLCQFACIVYISCNPHSLACDLAILLQTHCIKHLAFFDQFAYTAHLEMGVILVKKE